jgi:hypothetical protein
VEGNVFENNWQHGQGGSAILLKSTNQSGSCTWCGTQDVTFRLNLIKNTGSGFNIAAAPDDHPTTVHLQRVLVRDNVMVNVDVAPNFTGDGRAVMMSGDASDVVFQHNTILNPTNAAVMFAGPIATPPRRFVFRDNIVGGGIYGVKGPGLTSGSVSINACMPGGFFLGNVLILPNASGYPEGNFYTASVDRLGFEDAAALDFRVKAGSPIKRRASDGKDIGADVEALNAAIAGVVIP